MAFRQFSLILLPAIEGIPQTKWTADFILPNQNLIVEAKGEWINDRWNKEAKALYLLHIKLAMQLGFKVLTVGSKESLIGKHTIHNYRDKPWLQA
jgi:very-short-patch-repair endonuclease